MVDWARRLAWVLGIAVAAGSVLGALGRVWWGFDLLANFRLQYLLVLVVAAAILGATGAPRVAWLFVGLAVYNAALIAPLYLSDPRPVAGSERLEIVSSNMQLRNSRQQVNWLVASEPDLVFLFESSRQAEDLLRRSGISYEVTSGIVEEEAFGVTVLSRQPVEVEPLRIAGSGGDAVRLEAPLGGATVAVYAIHPPSPSNPFRSVARNRFLARIGQAAARESLPVVIVGDFNATPWSVGFRNVAEPGNLVNSQRGYGYSATWHARLWPVLGIPLDHLLHSEDLTTVQREVGPSLGPDHRPIRVVLGRSAGGPSDAFSAFS